MSEELLPKLATPKADLERQIMSSGEPKNEREWWAHHEIERLREQLASALAQARREERERAAKAGKLARILCDELYRLPTTIEEQASTCMDAADLLLYLSGTMPVEPSDRIAAAIRAAAELRRKIGE